MHIKHCTLNKNNFKLFLSKRYPLKIAERIANIFLTSKFMSNMNAQHLSYEKYNILLNQFLKSSLNELLIFTFQCYDLSGTGDICEHDIFQIFELFKENISVQNQIMSALSGPDLHTDVVRDICVLTPII